MWAISRSNFILEFEQNHFVKVIRDSSGLVGSDLGSQGPRFEEPHLHFYFFQGGASFIWPVPL